MKPTTWINNKTAYWTIEILVLVFIGSVVMTTYRALMSALKFFTDTMLSVHEYPLSIETKILIAYGGIITMTYAIMGLVYVTRFIREANTKWFRGEHNGRESKR